MFSTPKESIRLSRGCALIRLMARASSKKPRDRPPTDPMPARIDPCLASLVDKPPQGPDWAYEVKWDGYRLAVHIERGRVRILTRGGYDWTERFPTIADDARRIAVKTAILDGEAVVLDDKGRSDFGMLQRALGRLPSAVEAGAIVCYAFDLLYLDGRDLRRLPLRERRSGRGEWWQKITCKRRDSFVVVGFEPSTVPGHLGRLLLAARRGEDLVYVGGCGTGWSHDLSRELRRLLEGMATKTPAVSLRRKGAVFVEPVLVAEVEYRAWTDDGKLRHASFKGIREREDEAGVFEIGFRPS
ncbi:ATP-dependent DNA ligase [Sinorhizobium medicae]|nr:ATP-dependent DNA ligase [Sinorhizobium medicae]